MPERKPVYVAGYPRSGTSWLTRLLADVLNSPAAASHPSEDDGRDPASEGWERPGQWIVRKGHYQLVDGPGKLGSAARQGKADGPAVPSAHRLAWRNLDGPVVHIVRDPRDIAVSTAHYRGCSVDDALGHMLWGRLWNMPPWDIYVQSWLDAEMDFDYTLVSYEELSEDAVATVLRILEEQPALSDDKTATYERIEAAADRQSFLRRKPREKNPRFLRKGKAECWREEMPKEVRARATRNLAHMLLKLDYDLDMGVFE